MSALKFIICDFIKWRKREILLILSMTKKLLFKAYADRIYIVIIEKLYNLKKTAEVVYSKCKSGTS
jgi:hypothetical protein